MLSRTEFYSGEGVLVFNTGKLLQNRNVAMSKSRNRSAPKGA